MNPRCIFLIVAWLLAFAAIAQAVTIWIFCRSSWTPIERHHMSAYVWSSLPLVGSSTVEVRLMWKTRPHRKPQLATDNDADSSGDGTGLALSQSARDAGWKALIEGPPQQIPSDVLSSYLANLAFEGQSFWVLLLLPELSALAALCTVIGSWYLLIGFFRALPLEIAWRRQFSALWELSASFFEDCAALARRVLSGFKPLHRSAVCRTEMHSAALCTNIVQTQSPARPASFALPLFGVYNGTGKGYLWSERDAIE